MKISDTVDNPRILDIPRKLFKEFGDGDGTELVKSRKLITEVGVRGIKGAVLILEEAPNSYSVLTIKGPLEYMQGEPIEQLARITTTTLSIPEEWNRPKPTEASAEIYPHLQLQMPIATVVAKIYAQAIKLVTQARAEMAFEE